MKNLIRDTLKNPRTGEWSRKNLTAATSLFYAMWYTGAGLWFDKTVHEFVVIGFLTLAGGMLGVSSWEKKNLTQDQSPNNG